MPEKGNGGKACRLAALRRFAVAITALNLLGHTALGFEQPWAQPFVALAAAYATELLLETVNAWTHRRPPLFAGGVGALVDFLLPAHITGLACAMLLYSQGSLLPIVFAAVAATASKAVFRAPVGHDTRHWTNPSNTGIAITLLLFPWVGIAPPYQFTENLGSVGDWVLPAVIVCSGTFLNARYTGKVPLILAWLGGFVLQALFRSLYFGTPFVAALLPMTGVAFLLFTFYMVTDPATTPVRATGQTAFGLSVAAAYGLLQVLHVTFGLFFALAGVCLLRGIGLCALAALNAQRRAIQEPLSGEVELVGARDRPVAAVR